MTTTAPKFDGGKARLDLLPVNPLVDIAGVYEFGLTKYGQDTWRAGLQWSRLYAATLRHLFAFWSGEDIDRESGLSHLAHAGWNVLALLEFRKTHAEFDDRKHYERQGKISAQDIVPPLESGNRLSVLIEGWNVSVSGGEGGLSNVERYSQNASETEKKEGDGGAVVVVVIGKEVVE